MRIGQGSNELDSSLSLKRSSAVMLSEAKHLCVQPDRCFASLSMTLCDYSNCQGLFFTIEPCLNKPIWQWPSLIGKRDRADQSAVGTVNRPLRAYAHVGYTTSLVVE